MQGGRSPYEHEAYYAHSEPCSTPAPEARARRGEIAGGLIFLSFIGDREFMSTRTQKRVFWFDDGKRPNVADVLEKEQDIILHRLAFNGPQADNWGAMSASQAYCITSTRQELPDEYKCHAALRRTTLRRPMRRRRNCAYALSGVAH